MDSDENYHRTDGPAIEYQDGGEEWYWHGKLHRTDGPAFTNEEISFWALHGKCHRTDGPAVTYANGTQQWWIDGQTHRTDGPAIVYADGKQEWWFRGVEYDQMTHWLLSNKETV